MKKRVDLDVIASLIAEDARILDIGCGEGELLERLVRSGRRGVGLEINQKRVNRCVARGLSVMQGNADTDLVDYPDQAFDYVVLSQTLQAVARPRLLIKEMLRIGKNAIVSLPNFGYLRIRLSLFFHGRMPATELLPDPWYQTPNAHLCSIRDFCDLTREMDIVMERLIPLTGEGQPMRLLGRPNSLTNLFAQQAVFLLSAGKSSAGKSSAGKSSSTKP